MTTDPVAEIEAALRRVWQFFSLQSDSAGTGPMPSECLAEINRALTILETRTPAVIEAWLVRGAEAVFLHREEQAAREQAVRFGGVVIPLMASRALPALREAGVPEGYVLVPEAETIAQVRGTLSNLPCPFPVDGHDKAGACIDAGHCNCAFIRLLAAARPPAPSAAPSAEWRARRRFPSVAPTPPSPPQSVISEIDLEE